MKHVRNGLAVVLLLLAACMPALAQWQVPSNSVPVGRGGGAQGFSSVGPGLNKQTIFGNTGAAPAFRQPAFTDLTGNIAISQMNGGLNAGVNTFWRGDGSWVPAVGPFSLCAPPTSPAATTTAALQACLNGGGYIALLRGTYNTSAQLVPISNTTLAGGSSTIQQTVREARGFFGQNVNNLEISNLTVVGEGTFCGNPGQPITGACPNIPGVTVPGFGEWLGDGGIDGHNDRALQFNGCTNCRFLGVRTRNNGTAGYMFFGGNRIFVDNAYVEGTNAYTTPIAAQGNFQYGIALIDDATFGAIDNLLVRGSFVTGTAQGIIPSGAPGTSSVGKSRMISNTVVSNITGQHAGYFSIGNYVVDGFICNNIVDDCLKNQISNASADPYNFTATNVSADTVGGNMFTQTVILSGVGSHNIKLQGVGNAVGRGLSTSGPLTNLMADIQVRDTTGEAIVIAGDGPKDFDITLQSLRSGLDGILVTATNADRIRFHHPIVRQPSTLGGSRFAALVASATANVTFLDPVFADAGGLMFNGLSNSVGGGTVKILGSAAITGASSSCINATGGTVTLPLKDVVTSCTGGPYTTVANISRGDIADATVAVSGAYFKAGGFINFNSGPQLRETGGILVFENATSFRFSNSILPTAATNPTLGAAGSGFAALCLQTTSGSGNSLCQFAPSTGGASNLTWPAGTTNFTATGGASQVVKQVTAGGAFTVARLACADLSDAGAGCAGSGASGLTVGTTTVASGTTTRVLFDNAGVLGEYVISGTGNVAMTTNPVFTTPNLGTPSTVNLANAVAGSVANAALANASTTVNGQTCTLGSTCTISASAGTVTVGTTTIASGTTTRVLFDNAGVLGEYVISGTGNVAMTTNPVFTTPTLGVASGTSLSLSSSLFMATGQSINWASSDVTVTHSTDQLTFQGALNGYRFSDGAIAPSSQGGIPLGDPTLGFSRLYLAGGTSGAGQLVATPVAAGITWTLPATTSTLAMSNVGQTFTGTQTFTSAPVFTDQSGSRTALGLGTMATQNASAVAITGGTAAGLTGLGVRDTSAAFDVTVAATSTSATLTAGRTLTMDVGNVAHTVKFGTTANTITFPNLASFTVITNGDTGSVTNAMLSNASTTVNGQVCTLGSTCTISASAGTITVGTTTIASGTSHGVLTNNAGNLGNTAAGTNGQLFLGVTSGEPAFATMSGDATITNAGVLSLATTQAVAHTWSATQTFTVAPVFTDTSGSRNALALGTIATQQASAVAITGGTVAGLTGLAIRDTSAAFDVTLAAVSSATLTAGRTLTLDTGNVAHTLKFGTTANTITFPNLASYTVITNGDTGSVTNAMLANSSTTINGTAIALGASGTVTAAAGTLTGATLAAGVTASSLTSLGTITSLTAGSITSTGTSNAFGPGGTTNGNNYRTFMDGSSGTGGGAHHVIRKNAVSQWLVGSSSSVSASGSSDDYVIFDNAVGAIMTLTKGTSAATFSGTLAATIANVATTSAMCFNTTTKVFTYNGTVGTCTVSDERLKNFIGPVTGALDKLLKIQGMYYTWKDPKAYGVGRQIGVGAQTVEKVFPELVQSDSTGHKSADYQRLVAPIIEALRELKGANDNMELEIKALKSAQK